MKRILEFQFKNIQYVTYLSGKNFVFGKLNNGNIDTKLTIEEQNLFRNILKQLESSHNMLPISQISFLGKTYQIYKDTNKNIYDFKPFDINYLKQFNLHYNNQLDYVAIGNIKDSLFYKRIVKIGKKTLVVLLSTSISLSLTTSMIYDDSLDIRQTSQEEIISIVDIENSLQQQIEVSKELIDEQSLESKEEPVIASSDSAEQPEEQIEDIESLKDNLNTLELDSDTLVNSKQQEEVPQEIEHDSTYEVINLAIQSGNFTSEEEFLNKLLELGISINDSQAFEVAQGNYIEEVEQYESTKIQINDISDVQNALHNALSKNEKMTLEEKAWFLKMDQVIYDNLEYIDLEYYFSKLETIYITYNHGYEDADGTYDFINNCITFQGSSLSDVKDGVITHEILHSMDSSDSNPYPFFTESINAAFNDEYFRTLDDSIYDGAYMFDSGYLHFLQKLIGSEPFRKYQFNHDISPIRDALLEIIPDSVVVEDLLFHINHYHHMIYISHSSLFDETMIEEKELIKEGLKSFYAAKYGTDLDLMAKLYLEEISGNELLDEIGMTLTYEYDDPAVLNSANTYSFNKYPGMFYGDDTAIIQLLAGIDQNGNHFDGKILINGNTISKYSESELSR